MFVYTGRLPIYGLLSILPIDYWVPALKKERVRTLKMGKRKKPGNMKRNFFIVLIAALLLAPWPVVYAWDGANADTINSAMIQPADIETAPQIKAYGNAVGKVSPGDLFYVDMTGVQGDAEYQLIITNADELVHSYRFLNLKIGVFVQSEDASHWERLTATNGDPVPDIYITIVTGVTDFKLPAGARYKITIDTGCFYSYSLSKGEKAAIPNFYLSTNS